MSRSRTFARPWILGGVVLLLLVVAGVLARARLLAWAVDAALKSQGASDIRFAVERASPWHVDLADLGFELAAQTFGAKRVSVARRHWWTPNLGTVRIEQARIPVDLVRLKTATANAPAGPPPQTATYAAPALKRIPAEAISFEGQIVLHTGQAPDQVLTVKFEAREATEASWTGEVQASAPGLSLAASVRYDLTTGEVAWAVPTLNWDLKTWQPALGDLALLPAGPWEQLGTVAVKADGHYFANGGWDVAADVAASGMTLKGTARHDATNDVLAFNVPQIQLDVKQWHPLLDHFAPLPNGPWELAGTITGTAEGRVAGGKLSGAGRYQLRDGRAVNTAKAIVAEGVEADLEFIDFAQLTTRPGSLRVREVRSGKVAVNDLVAELEFRGPDRISVTRLSARALGGTVDVEPFAFSPSRSEIEAVVAVDGISAEEIMALTQDLPARVSGRVSGRLPVHFDGAGFRFGTGWLGLQPGSSAEIQFNAAGLLTGGMDEKSTSYAMMQKLESGLFKLKVSELRLEIRPPNAPEGRSATLHVTGEPVDPQVKAPVTLDLNVNGPLESLLNMGMKTGVSLGTKP